MHLAQRFPLLVLADAVQVEPGRAPQEHAAARLRRAAGFREDAVELDQARVDEERRLGAQELLGPGERERILEDGSHGFEAVPPATHRREDVAHEKRQPAGG